MRAPLALFGQLGYGNIGSGGEQFVIILIGSGQPLCGPISEDFLQNRRAPPLIKIRVFSQEGLKEEGRAPPGARLEEMKPPENRRRRFRSNPSVPR